MSDYLICTTEEYNQGVEVSAAVKNPSPVYSPDGTEVLVNGAGCLTIEQVKEHQSTSEAWKTTEGQEHE